MDAWGGPGWIQKVGWLTDAAISMRAFGGELVSVLNIYFLRWSCA